MYPSLAERKLNKAMKLAQAYNQAFRTVILKYRLARPLVPKSLPPTFFHEVMELNDKFLETPYLDESTANQSKSDIPVVLTTPLMKSLSRDRKKVRDSSTAKTRLKVEKPLKLKNARNMSGCKRNASLASTVGLLQKANTQKSDM